ncbi:MAG: CAP domain-containing protein [Patescibacteria group bacterium]|nr:CAP domain-containing protein [Patescibacteria group bacterium]
MIFSALAIAFSLPFYLLFNFSPRSYHSQIWSNPISFFITRPASKPLPTPSSIPTAKPSVTPTPKPSATSTPTPTLPVSNTTGNSYIYQINNYRRSQGLSPVKTDPYTCNFAKIRAGEIVRNFSHDGFTNRINSKTLPYPKFSYVTENIEMNSNSSDVVNQWINSPEHAANLRADTSYACVESSGNYYAYEGWKP